MRATPAGVAAGALAALRAPLWLRDAGYTRLMEPPATALPARALPKGCTGAAFLMLRILAKVPRSPWRYTCLYRSIAECLVLRRYGVPAVLRIGVRNENPPHGPIAAHAWVVRAPAAGAPPPAPTRDDLVHSLLVRG